MVDLVANELGVENLVRLREGGQKYVARCRATDGDAVLKIVSLEGIGNAGEVLERAKREVGLLADMDHPNLVRIRQPLTNVGDPCRRTTSTATSHRDSGGVGVLTCSALTVISMPRRFCR